MATNLVSQVATEVMIDGSAKARISQVATEVMMSGHSRARISQVAVEVLRSVADAATGMTFNVSATSSVILATTATEQDVRVISVSATSNVLLVGVGLAPQTFNRSATASLGISGVAVGLRAPKIVTVNATSAVYLTGTGLGSPIAGGPKIVTASAMSSLNLSAGASVGYGHVVFGSATTSVQLSPSAAGGRFGYLNVSATSGLSFRSSASQYVSPIHASATSNVAMAASAGVQAELIKHVSATSSVAVEPLAQVSGHIRTISVSATDTVAFEPAAGVTPIRTIHASATSGFAVSSIPAVSGSRSVSATSGMMFTTTAIHAAVHTVSATTSVVFSPVAASMGRVISVSATTSMGLTSAEPFVGHFTPALGTNTVSVTTYAGATIGWPEAVSTVAFRDLAVASVQLQSGGSVPGGDANAGLRAVAYPVCSGTFPNSYAETPSGLVLIANGVDPMLRWDGLAGVADTAGVQAPATAVALGGQDVGTLVGMRQAYCRFVDKNGNPSAPSPISNAVNLGRDGNIENLAVNPSTGVVTIQSGGHGLDSTDIVVIQGLGSLAIQGIQAITTIDQDHFTLTTARATSGKYQGGGSWTWGVAEVVYNAVPVPVEPKVVRRQILRNLDGVADVYYVDVDTTDLISPTFTSTRTDESLSACEPVPITTQDGLPYASRYAAPPSHKSILASHSGRIFACGEVTVSLGNVSPRFGTPVMFGVGTAWTATLAGRFLYVAGATQPYEIASVNVAAQSLTLVSPYADLTQPYAAYSIRPAPGERRLVYYTEPGLPEAWPPWNAFAIPEEDDELVGMMTRTGLLYFVEKRHIHRFTMQGEPSEGQDFASINRGAINGRCFVQVENTSYMFDEAGIHAFDGGQSTEPISTPIQSMFQGDGLLGGLMIDWSADSTLWHASHDPVRNTIRFFAQMVGYAGIYHAICYDYRRQGWWIEEYPTAITSSCTGVVGYRRAMGGTDARRVVVFGEGSLDLVDGSVGNLGGIVTSADSTSLTDAAASFPGNLAGAPVSISNGTGRGQQAMIAENTANTLTIVQPWTTIPDLTSTYQVGGVGYRWRSGWFELATEEESENPRDVTVTYQPTVNPATMDLQFFYDHSAVPESWSDYAISQDGVTVLPNDPNITINLQTRQCRSGWSLQRFGGHSEVYAYGQQFLQILLVGVQASESVRIFQVNLNGVRSAEDA